MEVPARLGAPFPAHLGWSPVLGPLGRGSGVRCVCPGSVALRSCVQGSTSTLPWAGGGLSH